MNRQTVLITGASRGIGHAIADMCINKNFNTILVCHNNISMMDDLADKAHQNGLLCLTYLCDVSSYPDVSALFSQLAIQNIHIDVLINNAGISHIGLLQDMSIDDWHTMIDTNLSSVFYFSRHVIHDMLAYGHGKIINISSVWGVCGASCEVAYSASKGGINAFTMALAKELAPSNIQVNAIACGAIDTDMNKHLSDEEALELTNEIPAGRMGTPQEVAHIVHGIIMSPDYMTGQIIRIDGGWI